MSGGALEKSAALSLVRGCMCISQSGQNEELRAYRTSRRLSKQLKEWRKSEDSVIKLLLLGTGESGKSTITKQMKIIHINGFNTSERKSRIEDIRKNLRDCILVLLGAMENLGVPFHHSENKSIAEKVTDQALSNNPADLPIDFYEKVSLLWKDEGLQKCYSRSNEFQLLDCAKYFLDKAEQVGSQDYLPNDQDILRSRSMTNSIHRTDFSIRDGNTDVPFSVFDVGGQRGERRKWIQVFDSVTVVLFVLDCSCYDLVLREDHSKNRLLEAMEIFEQVWNNRFMRNTSLLLFINKIDMLVEKIDSNRSLNYLIERLDNDNRYASLFSEFDNFHKVKDSERCEFLESLPRKDEESNKPRNMSQRRRSRVSVQRDDVSEEVLRTAVFIKRTFMQLIAISRSTRFGREFHENHTCEYYYTCAVDTDNIAKVLAGSRSLILKEYFRKIGIPVY